MEKNFLVRHIRILFRVGHATLKEWAAYRSHMVLSLVIGPLMFILQLGIWQAVFQGKNVVGGFTLGKMIQYYAVITLMNYIIMDFAAWNLQMLIHTGRYLTFALRPVSHCFFAFAQKAGHRVLGFTIEFFPMVLVFLFVFKINLVPAEPGWFIVSVFLSFCINFLLNYSMGILGFWMVRTEGIRFIYGFISSLFAGSIIPLSFLPDVLQSVFFFLPFQFIVYVPVRVFFGSYSLGGVSLSLPAIVGIQGVALIVVWFLTRILNFFGIKKFTGVGA
jgi:ABC-2 type transport system permease protein